MRAGEGWANFKGTVMRLPFLKHSKRGAESKQDLERIRSVFSKFRRIQKLNTKILGLMAEMERALGGEYIFDRSFLDRSVRDLGADVYQVVYSLNALSGNRYIGLFDRFQTVKNTLEDVLAGGLGAFESSLAIPSPELGWELEPMAGIVGVCLAEARNRLGISAPDGFAVTVQGCRKFIIQNRLGRTNGSGPEPAGLVFPPELEEAILREREELFKRRGGPVNLVVRACSAGGSENARFNFPARDVAPDDLLSAVKLAVTDFIKASAGSDTELSCALAIHESIQGGVSGSVKAGPAGLLHVTAVPTENPGREDSYLVRRVHPFNLVQSNIHPKSHDRELKPGVKSLSHSSAPLRRGSGLLDPAFLRSLAGTAAAIERILGRPHEMRWTVGEAGRPVILDVRPVAVSNDHELDEGEFADLSGMETILRGGETVQTGIAAGRVMHVNEQTKAETFPRGSVAVARNASPQLSLVLRRASAIITETGTSVSHLATIARELRVPAIFGVPGALDRLREGTEITVDATERTVYRGVIESLLNQAPGSELFPSDPEYVMLRFLLRFIMPLGLVDPESRDFLPENCRTYHDIIHFSHERSVDELLHVQERHRGLNRLHPRWLAAGVPLAIYVLDIEASEASEGLSSIEIDELNSEPLLAFIRGLTVKEMWESGPASLRMRDIFSNLDRTFLPPAASEKTGRNLAVVARNYMNLGLQMGYHFSVIDCFLGEDPNQNYVYFRFAGGFAEDRKRRRRAELIRMILDGMDFKVSVKGDLVTGKFKGGGPRETSAVLTRLGELTAFTRQLDTSMTSEQKIEDFAQAFFAKAVHGVRISGESQHV